MCCVVLHYRYTDPVKGIVVNVNIDVLEKTLQFSITVRDNNMCGMPVSAVQYLLENMGRNKVFDYREKKPEAAFNLNGMVKERPSSTGLSHLVELYHHLTSGGDEDFDLQFSFYDDGTLVRIRFTMPLISPVSFDTSSNYGNTCTLNAITGM